MRSPNPIASVQLPERVYAMDIANNVMAVACAERYICAFKFDDPGRIWKVASHLCPIVVLPGKGKMISDGFSLDSL